jgi:hypothetical protein
MPNTGASLEIVEMTNDIIEVGTRTSDPRRNSDRVIKSQPNIVIDTVGGIAAWIGEVIGKAGIALKNDEKGLKRIIQKIGDSEKMRRADGIYGMGLVGAAVLISGVPRRDTSGARRARGIRPAIGVPGTLRGDPWRMSSTAGPRIRIGVREGGYKVSTDATLMITCRL